MNKIIFILILLSLQNVIYAQMDPGGYLNPDTLEVVTINGTVVLDESSMHPMYYLDENGDGVAEYHLNFGPNWYEPDSSSAARPSHGDNINVTGGLNDNSTMTYPVIVVYEINGEFWRDPFFASWNNMGTHNHYLGGHHNGGSGYYGFGWQHDTLESVTIAGAVLVDTTFYMNHYYLDTDNDVHPDFTLNFGPPWYEPESGIERPENGEQVNIAGGVMNDEFDIPMIIVYEMNSEIWRDSNSIGTHFGGGWFNRNIIGNRQFQAPFDPKDIITVTEGWRTEGHGGGYMMPDSLFCQILEIYPENLQEGNNFFAEYEVQMFLPDGSSGMMGGNGMGGGRMTFANDLQFQLHYSDSQLEYYNVDEETINAKYWNDQDNDWVSTDFVIDKQNNIVSFSSSEVSNYLVLAAEEVTDIFNSEDNIVKDFILQQNYPNPFNPSTTISFQINFESHIVINVFNMTGEKVAELVNRQLGPGKYDVDFVAYDLPSGIYFYKLITDTGSITKGMILMK